MVDAAFGELMVTCEKAMWLVNSGQQHLMPERRAPGRMVRLAARSASLCLLLPRSNAHGAHTARARDAH